MRRSKFLPIVALLALILALGCGSDDSSTEIADSNPAGEIKEDNSSTTRQADQENPNTAENLPWTFLTNGIYHNDATLTVGKPMQENPNNGHWIDFKDNGTYEYGVWGKKQFDGTYFYDDRAGTLELKPKSAAEKPSEWQVMHKNENLILVGTSKYGNNATQMRWIRHTDYPSKG